jgi:phage baseplate assembly protein W
VHTNGSDAQNAHLGVDVFFNGDFETTAAGDLAIVTGFAALNQAIYQRLITRPGSFAYRPGYGVGIQKWAKRRNDQTSLNELEQVVEDQLSFEKRISRVRKVFVAPLIDGPGVQLGFDIEAYGETATFRPLQFSADGVINA